MKAVCESFDPGHVIAQARRWIGTPYRHQASCLGAGADCLGLVRGVWRALLGDEPEAVPAYTKDWAEPQGDEVILRAAMRHFVPLPEGPAQAGDLLLFRMRAGAIAKHLAICSVGADQPCARFVHAYSGHAVMESPLSGPWARRIVARFAFPKGV